MVLVLRPLAIAFVNWMLGLAVRHQQMSLAGLRSGAMAVGAWAAGGVFGLFLLCARCSLVRIALRDRAPGRFGRIVLIVCAVVHGVLGAAVVGLVGWAAFVVMMVVLGAAGGHAADVRAGSAARPARGRGRGGYRPQVRDPRTTQFGQQPRSSGSERPMTLPGSPSMPSTNGAERPSRVKAPATCSGSPVAT